MATGRERRFVDGLALATFAALVGEAKERKSETVTATDPRGEREEGHYKIIKPKLSSPFQ